MVTDPEWHADEGAAAVLGVAGLTEAGIRLDVLDQDRLAELHHLARDAFADLDLDLLPRVVLEPAPDGHAQHLALAIEQHDRADPGAHRAHRALQHVGEEVLNLRDLRGHLHYFVQRAELEDEVLEALGRASQLGEHAAERLRDVTDLGDLSEAGHDVRLRRLCRRRVTGALEHAAQICDAIDQLSEEHEPEEGDQHGEQHTDLGLRLVEALEPPHEEGEEQDRQDCDQAEDRESRPAERYASLHAPTPVVVLVIALMAWSAAARARSARRCTAGRRASAHTRTPRS